VRIGYLVEGATDAAVVRGLRDQLCPRADLLQGSFRGSSGARRKAELRRTCVVLAAMGADVIVDLNDANELAWHQRRDQERQCASPEHLPLLVFGAPEPNIESWLVADVAAFAGHTGVRCAHRPPDAKPLVERAFQVTGTNRRTAEITAFVAHANLQLWESSDNSFRGFIRECRDMAHRLGCTLGA